LTKKFPLKTVKIRRYNSSFTAKLQEDIREGDFK